MKVRTGKVIQAPRARWLIQLGGTDSRRWGRHAGFDAPWSSRHQLIAAWGWVNAHTVAGLRATLTAAGREILEDAEWASQHIHHLRTTQA